MEHPINISSILLYCFIAIGLFCCNGSAPTGQKKAQQYTQAELYPTDFQPLTPEELIEAERLAKVNCAACHPYTPPEVLPKAYWQERLLPTMGKYLGIRASDIAYLHDLDPIIKHRLDSAKVFPTEPLLDHDSWSKLWRFYLSQAPEQIDQGARPQITSPAPLFQAQPIRWKTAPVGASLVQILGPDRILAGSSLLDKKNDIVLLNLKGEVLGQAPIPSPLVHATPVKNGLILALMGSYQGNDNPIGSIGGWKYAPHLGLIEDLSFLLQNRERPIHLQYEDFNQDGKSDLLVAEFGKQLGGLFLYIASPKGYQKQTLHHGAGAIHTQLKDVNQDGIPDIYALVAQGDEAIYLFTSQPDGQFLQQKILQFPPYYGSTYFELVDFDQDGIDDIIYSCGDSGDYGMPPKSFHGIRHFKGIDSQFFEEEWFYPQQGTYKAMVRDFDQDGDYDIASVGFFAYPAGMPAEGFLYLDNQGIEAGKANFKPFSFEQAKFSSWMVMDAGDVDADGDLDIILGANTSVLPEKVMFQHLVRWQQEGGALVLLENKLK